MSKATTFEFGRNDLPVLGVIFRECKTEREAIDFVRFAERMGYKTMRWYDPEIKAWVARVRNW